MGEDLRSEIQAELQVLSPPESIHDVEQADDQETIQGWERRDEGGDVTEAVHLHAHYAHVVWFDYRGWSLSRDTSIKWLQPLLTRAMAGSLKLSGVGLAYRDVFFNDDVSAYRADDLLRRDSRHLPAISFDTGPQWRHGSSWAEQDIVAGLQVRRRHRLEIEAEVLSEEGDDHGEPDLHMTEALHSQTLVVVGNSAGAVEWSEEVLGQLWDSARDANRKVVSSLLTREMLVKIGLTEDL